jgi:hypothetical protein
VNRKPSRRAAAAAVAIVVITAAIVVLGSQVNLEHASWLAAVVAVGVAIAAWLTPWVGPASAKREDAATKLAEISAEMLLRLRGEAELRGLNDPAPLRLSWTVGGGPPSGVCPLDADRAVSSEARRVAQAYRDLPNRRLIVTGRPGSGKSTFALLLAIGLCETRGDLDPIPLLTNFGSWNPDEQHIFSWLGEQIAVSHPRSGLTADGAAALAARGLIIPILDGLDELPATTWRSAINALRTSMPSERPFVATCEEAQYARRTNRVQMPSGLVEFRLDPVATSEAVSYIASAAAHVPGFDARLRAVLENEDPGSPLAEAFATPLGVWLACTYLRAGGTSEPLLVTKNTGDALLSRLLDLYVPSVLQAGPLPPGLPPRHSWNPRRAERYLRILARGLRGHHDFNWWDAWRYTFWPAETICHLLFAASVLTVFSLASAWIGGLTSALVAAAVFVPISWLFSSNGPLTGIAMGGLLAQAKSEGVYNAVGGVLFGLPLAALAFPVATLMFGAKHGVLLGCAVVVGGVAVIRIHQLRVSVARHAQSMLGAGVAIVVIGLPAVAVAALASNHPPAVLLGFVGGTLASALRPEMGFDKKMLSGGSTGRWWTLAALKKGAIVLAVGVLVAGALLPVETAARALLLGLGCAGWTAVAALGMSTSYCISAVAGAGLWMRGRGPFRIRAFLADAHRLGILRSSGGAYEFRHRLLQQRLAEKRE